MEHFNLYYIIGFITAWLLVGFGVAYVFRYLSAILIHVLLKITYQWLYFVNFIWHRKRFIRWFRESKENGTLTNIYEERNEKNKTK